MKKNLPILNLAKYFYSLLIMFFVLFQLSAQDITVATANGVCFPNGGVLFTLTGNDGGTPVRNIYTGDFPGTATGVISWNSANNRWESVYQGFSLDVWSTYASSPNPPDMATGNWQATGFCGAVTQLDGSGTQNFLPVEYISFDAKISNEGIQLNWVTASEINNEKFEIEHSSNGIDFKKIDEVAGSGNSFEMLNYQFIDYNALRGTNYYRLKQIDFDGTSDYSKVVSIDFSAGENAFRIAPNPTSGASTVAFNFEDSKEKVLTIYNSLGAKVYQTAVEEEQYSIEIPLPNLSQGIYTAEVVSGRTRSIKRMFIR